MDGMLIPTYYILRAPDLNFRYEGYWYDDLNLNLGHDHGLDPDEEYRLVETGRTERREDGAVGIVVEIHKVVSRD